MRVGGVCARVIGMPRTSIRLLFNLISSSSPFISFYFETLSFFVFKKRKRILIFSSQTVALPCLAQTRLVILLRVAHFPANSFIEIGEEIYLAIVL